MTTLDRERLRRAIIRLLAAHRDASFRVPVLIERLLEELPGLSFSETDVLEHLSFLAGMDIVRQIPSALQGPPTWQITQQGALFHERTS